MVEGAEGKKLLMTRKRGRQHGTASHYSRRSLAMYGSSPTALCTHLLLKVCTCELKCIAESLSTGQTDAQTVWRGERRVTGL